ncbi:MAG: DNA polymerase III subunit beta [Candidatus Paceibacterota bacterium]
MEINISRPQLTQALELVTRISTKHVTLPVLQCALLEVSTNKLKIKATNLELSIEVSLDCKVSEDGVVAVPANTLMQSLQYNTENEISLREEEGVLIIETNKTNTSIKSIPHDEFPTINKLKGEAIKINRELFSLGIKTTAFAASVSSIKPELGSVYIQQKKEHSLTLVSTDSFRLMEKTVPQKGVILEQGFLVPQKNAMEISRLCDLLQSDPGLVVTENQCALDFAEEGVYVTSRLVSGSFPDYEQIIPKEYVSHVTVLKNDLLKAFKKTSIFLNKYQQVTISVVEGSLTMSSQNNEVGHVTDSVPAVVDGEELTLNFNQQYVVDSLSHITDESVILHFAGIGRPLVITGVSDKTLRYLVMPMNR